MVFTQDPFMTDSQTGLGENFEIGWKYSYASYISIIVANFIRNLGWPARPLPTFNAPYFVAPVLLMLVSANMAGVGMWWPKSSVTTGAPVLWLPICH